MIRLRKSILYSVSEGCQPTSRCPSMGKFVQKVGIVCSPNEMYLLFKIREGYVSLWLNLAISLNGTDHTNKEKLSKWCSSELNNPYSGPKTNT